MWHTVHLRCKPQVQQQIFLELRKICNHYSGGISNALVFGHDWNKFVSMLDKQGLITSASKANLNISIIYDYYRQEIIIYVEGELTICRIPIHLRTWEEKTQLELLLFRKATIVLDDVENMKHVIQQLRRIRPKTSIREIFDILLHINSENMLSRMGKKIIEWVRGKHRTYKLAIQFSVQEDLPTFRFVLTRWTGQEGKSAYIVKTELSDKEYGIRGMNVSTILNKMFKLVNRQPLGPTDIHIVVGVFVLSEKTCVSILRQFNEFKEEYSTDNVSVDDFLTFYRSIEKACVLSLSSSEKRTETLTITFLYDAPIDNITCAMHWQEKNKIVAHSFRLMGKSSVLQSTIFHSSSIVVFTKKDILFSRAFPDLLTGTNSLVSEEQLLEKVKTLLQTPHTFQHQHQKGHEYYFMVTAQSHEGSCHFRLSVGHVIHLDKMTKPIAEKHFIVENVDCNAVLSKIREISGPPQQISWVQQSSPRRSSSSSRRKSSSSSLRRRKKKSTPTISMQQRPFSQYIRSSSSSSQQQGSVLPGYRGPSIETEINKRQVIHRLPKPNQIVAFTQTTQDNIKNHIVRELLAKQMASKLLTSAYGIKATRIVVVDGPNLTFRDYGNFNERETFIASKEFSKKMMEMYSEKDKPVVFLIISQKNLPHHPSFHKGQKLVCVKSYQDTSGLVLTEGAHYNVLRATEAMVELQEKDADTIELPRHIVEQYCVDVGYEEFVSFQKNKKHGDKNNLFFYSRVGCYDVLRKKNCYEVYGENECDDFVRKDTIRRLRLMIRKVKKDVVHTLDMNKEFRQNMSRISMNPFSTFRKDVQNVKGSMSSLKDMEYYIQYPSVVEASNDKGRNWRYNHQQKIKTNIVKSVEE